MSSSAIATPQFQAKIGSIQNQADSSSVYSNGVWSFKNSTALTSVTITDAGRVGVLATSPRGVLDLNTTREAKIYLGTAGVIGETQANAGDYIANNLFVSAETAGTMTYTKTTADSGNAIVQDFSRGIAFYSGVTGAASSTGTLNNFERMRIDASGNLLVGNSITAAGGGSVGVKNSILFSGGTSGSTTYYTIQSNTSDFYIGNSTLTRYAALINIGSFTAWSFGSDRRIKKDIEDIKYGLEDVLNIQPRQYKLKDNNQVSIGFIAQELKEVIPEAVTGEEVPFDDNDTPQERASKTMGVSKDTLIPVLVKAIQELSAKVDAQAEEIKALKAQP